MTMPDEVPDQPHPHDSLLGKPTTRLRLKVSKGSRHRGQVVDIRRQKCTVGSAEDCSLRLLEPGIAPVECLILRGAVGNVVRWLDVRQMATDGELFQDELLRPGDQFRVGPLQLEVLEEHWDAPQAAAPPSAAVMSACLSRLERLENVLTQQFRAEQATERHAETMTAAPQSSAALAQLTQQLLELQSQGDARRSQWEAERHVLEAANANQGRQLQELQQLVEQLRSELEVLRDESQRAFDARDATGLELDERTRQLAEQTQLWSQRHAAWEAERIQLENLVQQQAERLRDVELRLEATNEAQLESAGTLESWEQECHGLRSQLCDAAAQIQTLKQEVEKHRQQAVDAESRAHELVLQGVSQAQAATAVASEKVREDLLRLQSQYDGERERWDAERRILHEDLQAQRLQIEQQQLALLRAPAAPSREPIPSPLRVEPVAEEPADERADEPAMTSAAYRPAWATVDADDDPMSRFLSRSHPASTLPADEEPTYGGPSLSAYLPATADDDLGGARPSFTAQTYASEPTDDDDVGASLTDEPERPTSTAQILARLRESHVWSDNPDEENSYRRGSNGSSADEPQISKDAAREDDSPTPAGTAWKSPVDATLDDDESIEAYMNRLLKRVRVGSQEEEESKRPAPVAVDRAPMMEISAPVVEEQDDEPAQPKISLEDYRPRTAAPEHSHNLHAMRALANDNTRTAMATHARRNWANFMKLKLGVSVFAITAIAASMIFFWGNPILVTLGSCVGVAVMFYWLRQARTYRQLLVESMMRDSAATGTNGATQQTPAESLAGE